jgi:hypothetical protein
MSAAGAQAPAFVTLGLRGNSDNDLNENIALDDLDLLKMPPYRQFKNQTQFDQLRPGETSLLVT